VVFAAVCFATTGTAQELGPDNSSSVGIATMRTIIGAALLYALSWYLGRKQPVGSPNLEPKHIPPYIWLFAAAGMALFAGAFFASVRQTGIAIGTVIALASAPLITGLLSALLWKNVPTLRWIIATSMALVGMTLLVAQGNDVDVKGAGVLLAIAAGFGYAVFAMSSKLIVTTGIRAELAMARVFTIAALMMAPTLFFVNLNWLATFGGLVLVIWLGAITVALAYWSYSTGLRSIAPSEATMLTLVEPVMATILGAVVLGHQPTALAWLGIAIVIGALAFESRGAGDQSATPAETQTFTIQPLSTLQRHWQEAAQLSYNAWRHDFPEDTSATYLEQLALDAASPGALPEIYVAISPDDELLGLASLVADDYLPGATEPGPWLAAVFVTPEARSRGIGAALVRHIIERCRQRGDETLYLYTEHQQSWYETMGWTFIRETPLNDIAHVVMYNALISSDPSALRSSR